MGDVAEVSLYEKLVGAEKSGSSHPSLSYYHPLNILSSSTYGTSRGSKWGL